jgi:hypothetical protein
VLAGAVLGASLISLKPKPAPSAGVSPEVLQALPGLVGKNFEFDQREIRVNAGETVALLMLADILLSLTRLPSVFAPFYGTFIWIGVLMLRRLGIEPVVPTTAAATAR